jgi:L-lactate dehydrogenase (cytochrome)
VHFQSSCFRCATEDVAQKFKSSEDLKCNVQIFWKPEISLDKTIPLTPYIYMDFHAKYMTISDLQAQAKKRLPHFTWEFLHSGTGDDGSVDRNRSALDRVGFYPSILHGEVAPNLRTEFLGQSYDLPFGVAPVGHSGLFWPGAEAILAQSALTAGLPYSLSTVATMTPEEVGPLTGNRGWFQLYPPRDEEIRRDLLARAKGSGFETLILTVDVPVASRRERQVRGGLTQPPRVTPRIFWQCLRTPSWSLRRAQAGMPHMKTLDKYSGDFESRDPTAHIGYLLRTAPGWDYLHWLRDHWQGPLIVKGVLNPKDAPKLEAAGVDALWVSNHGGRQFAGAPGTADALAQIRKASSLPLIYDGAIEGGLDIIRAYALGADFVMMGRAWHYALTALGPEGPKHLTEILQRDLVSNLGQLGAQHPKDLRGKHLFF